MRRAMSQTSRPSLTATLLHYWRTNLAVVGGAAVATAVLAGALVVGDSVRGSLRELTLERLGGIDYALAGQRFVRQELAEELAVRPDFSPRFGTVAPAILLQGSAEHAASRRRASNVQLTGVDGGFLQLFDAVDLADQLAGDGLFPAAVINRSLAEALGAEPGDDLVVALERWSEVPEGSLLSRKDTGSVVGRVRLRLASIVEDRGIGRFGLATHQASTFNVFVERRTLAEALGQEGSINALLVERRDDEEAPDLTDPVIAAEEREHLDALLRQVLTSEDLGLIVEPRGDVLSLESQEYILDPSLVDTVGTLAQELGAERLPILTYLVNRLEVVGDGDPAPATRRPIPYSMVSALGELESGAFGRLPRLGEADGEADIGRIGDDAIVLNRWSAEALAAGVGDTVELTYFVVGPREDLREETARLEVAAVVEIEGLAADPTLSQEYPGIAGSDNMADWDPPFPIDLGQIEAADEDYWDEYRGTPKAFVSAATGRRLWRNRWGDLTALRLAPATEILATEIPATETLAALDRSLRAGLVEQLPLESLGLVFQPVKQLGLSASGGATDFSGLFIGFSLFLIASAALLVALLFSLGVEQRAGEIGLLLAVGYPHESVRRRLLIEGVLLAAVGALIGLVGAVVYAEAMMFGLRTWWLPAVGTSRLDLHVSPATLAMGWAASMLVVVATLWFRIRALRKLPAIRLLARRTEAETQRPGHRAGWIATLALGLAILLVAVAVATGSLDDPALFGLAGVALLVGGLALFARWLGRGHHGSASPGPFRRSASLVRMALANGARNRGRSLLSTTLVACASYMIVTVAAFQQDFTLAELGQDSGTGGYALVAESDVPLLRDLDSADGRFELGIGESTELTESSIVPMRLLPGDDTSCLNLYQPRQPRLLAAPPALVERGAFRFQKQLDPEHGEAPENPWDLLDQDLGEGVIPAIGDANSTQWILKLGLGDELTLEDEAGEPLRLKLVATLATSIFQSELLVSERHLLEHFPSQAGWSVFLVDSEHPELVAEALEAGLGDYGFDAMPTAEKLEAFHTVQNTYLSTFRTLGGLGLLLGTLGLAIVLLRGAMERRGELATLRAFGFRRGTLISLVVVENALLLAVGLAAGSVAALVTATPNLLLYATVVPWHALFSTLAAVFLLGLVACTLAAWGALRLPLLPALKADR